MYQKFLRKFIFIVLNQLLTYSHNQTAHYWFGDSFWIEWCRYDQRANHYTHGWYSHNDLFDR